MAASWFYLLTLVILIIIAILIVVDIVFYNRTRHGLSISPNWSLTMIILWGIVWIILLFIIFFALWLLFSHHLPRMPVLKIESVESGPVITNGGCVAMENGNLMYGGVSYVPADRAFAPVSAPVSAAGTIKPVVTSAAVPQGAFRY